MNALSSPIMEGLVHGLLRLAGDPAVKVVVLTGAGRAFCAVGEVKSMAESGDVQILRLRRKLETDPSAPSITQPRPHHRPRATGTCACRRSGRPSRPDASDCSAADGRTAPFVR